MAELGTEAYLRKSRVDWPYYHDGHATLRAREAPSSGWGECSAASYALDEKEESAEEGGAHIRHLLSAEIIRSTSVCFSLLTIHADGTMRRRRWWWWWWWWKKVKRVTSSLDSSFTMKEGDEEEARDTPSRPSPQLPCSMWSSQQQLELEWPLCPAASSKSVTQKEDSSSSLSEAHFDYIRNKQPLLARPRFHTHLKNR